MTTKEKAIISLIKEKFKDIGSFKKIIEYLNTNYPSIKKKGGSSRRTWFLDNIVIKVAINKKGLAQNEFETEMIDTASDYGIQAEDAVPKLYEILESKGKKYAVLILEKINIKNVASKFKKRYGFPIEAFFYNLADMFSDYRNKVFKQQFVYDGLKKDLENYNENYEDDRYYQLGLITDLIGNTDLSVSDLVDTRQYGFAKRDGVEELVILDLGLSPDIWETHYSK